MKNNNDSKENILTAASRLFQVKGYNATGLNEILKESNSPKGSLYYYFPNGKEELALEAIKLSSQFIQTRIQKALAEYSNPVEAIQYNIKCIIESLEEGKVQNVSIGLLALETHLSSEPLREACEEAFLFYRAKRQDLQGKQILSINEKYYMADHGIRQALMGTNARDIGLILENMVYLELLRRGFHVTVGRVGEREIDFVCEKAGRVLYFQVCYLLATEETIDREFGVFSFIKDNHPKYVLSLDDFDMSREGIKHMNIQDFLLSDEWS